MNQAYNWKEQKKALHKMILDSFFAGICQARADNKTVKVDLVVMVVSRRYKVHRATVYRVIRAAKIEAE